MDDLQTEAVAEINVTPMIDVLLSLLIIFMVAAKPPPKHKQPITIPKDPIEQTENDPNATLLIKIDAAGAVSVGKTPITGGRAELIAALQANEKAQTDGRVAIKADGKVPYASVIDVMAAAREAGIPHVGIASERL
ncbi:MAG TPA: biopolymer transporter ExbD [Enhygromyxa sp.]|nr:biopolymer transporter ExbD [Enhygromyxa sp.]